MKKSENYFKLFHEILSNGISTEDLNEMIFKIEKKLCSEFSLNFISLYYLTNEYILNFKLTCKQKIFNFKHLDKKNILFPTDISIEKKETFYLYKFPFFSKSEDIEAFVEIAIKEKFTSEELQYVKLLLKSIFLYFLRLYKARRLALHDELTDLYNNRYLKEYLKQESIRALRYNTKFSIIFLDLDGLKEINDSYGHIYGAKTLKELGKLLKKHTRSSDVVGRFGGDEFIIVIFGASKKEAKSVAERLRKKIKENVFLKEEGYNIKLTASFGIASFPEDATNIDELINKADKAMYQVKKSGKDGVQCYKED